MLKIIECKGYTKEEAFKNLPFDPNSPIISGANATHAWKKAGSPIPGTLEFKRFVTQQLQAKTKSQPGFGIHIVVDPPIKDIRTRPYTIVNNKVEGTREWKFVYWIREDVLDVSTEITNKLDEYGETVKEIADNVITVLETGKIIEMCDSKAEALDKVKDLTSITHKCYSILAVKVPNTTPIAAYCIYTPSTAAKLGTFIACGINTRID